MPYRGILTSGQYSPVRPSRSVSKGLIFYIRKQERFREVTNWDPVCAEWTGLSVLKLCFIIIPLSCDSSGKVVFIRHSGFPYSSLPRVCLATFGRNAAKRTEESQRYGRSSFWAELINCFVYILFNSLRKRSLQDFTDFSFKC